MLYHTQDDLGIGNVYYLKSTSPLLSAPAVEVFPDSLDFGAVAVGDSLRRAITVVNTGNAPLIITGITAPPGFSAYFLPGDSIVLAPDSLVDILVAFRPDSAITYQGFLQVFSNAPESPSQVFVSGLGAALSAEDPAMSGIPDEYYLAQNYPNPFNPSTTIEFGIPENSRVEIRVHDLLGREVAVLVDDMLQAGIHRVTWNCTECASGTYLIVLSGPDFSIHRKAILMR